MPSRVRVLGLFVAALTASAVVVVACREPTSIKLEVVTSFPCSALGGNSVGVRVGSEVRSGPVQSLSTACVDQSVGHLVLTPSGAGDRVVIEVMAALAPATLDSSGTCAEGTAGCIHARRSLTYIPHTTTNVRVQLDSDCAGFVCQPNETCAGRRCVPADCGNTATSCTPGDAGAASDAGTDGGPPPGYVALCGDTTALQSGSPYPMSTGCAGGSAVSAVKGPASAPTREKIVTLSGKGFNVVIDKDNVAYVSTNNGTVDAIPLDAPTATPKWTAILQGTTMQTGSAVVAASGVLYFASDTEMIPLANDGGPAGARLLALSKIRSDIGMTPSGRLLFSDTASDIESMNTSPSLSHGPTAATGANHDYMHAVVASGVIWNGAATGLIEEIDPVTMTQTGSVVLTDAGGTGYFVRTALGPDGLLRALWGIGGGSFSYGAIDRAQHKVVWSKKLPGTSLFGADMSGVTPTGAMWVHDDANNFYVHDSAGNQLAIIGNDAAYPGFDVDGYAYLTPDATANMLASYDEKGNQRWATAFKRDLDIIVVGKNGTIIGTSLSKAEAYVYQP